MKSASFFPRRLLDRRGVVRSILFACATCAAPALSGFDCKILPDDVLVSRGKGAENAVVNLTLLVRPAAADAAPWVVPEKLHVRVTNGTIMKTVEFALKAVPPAGTFGAGYAEYRYRGELPSSARGPTLLETVEADPFPTARTMISVMPVSDEARVNAAPPEHQPAALLPDAIARKATLKAIVPGLLPNEPIYFALGAFRGGVHRLDARFQLSLKYRFTDENETIGNLGAAITTTSLWDLHSYSVPFRDSTYRPAVLWMIPSRKSDRQPNFSWSADIGIFEHESNGRGPDPDQPLSAANNDSLSRSMNRSYLRPTFSWTYKNGSIFNVSPKLFVPFLVSKGNSDIAQYRGYADLLLKWTSQKQDGHVVSLLAREGTRSGRHFLEFDYGLPFRALPRVSFDANGWVLFQWLYGYGETLRDYRVRNPGTLRVGLMIVP